MCGIVGYIGRRPAVPLLIDGLKRLEYRGYDSAGVAVISNSHLDVVKSKGKLSFLQEKLEKTPLRAKTGIAHTRWATHGPPADVNAHPLMDSKQHIALVHNGIIENYLPIKKQLEASGHIFRSETDTEVMAHLIEKYYRGDLTAAVLRAVKDVEGSYAICVICDHEPEKIVCARQDSPLVVGLGHDEFFIASDIPAFLPYTKKVQHVKDREVVVLEKDKVTFYDFNGNQVDREVVTVHWDNSMAEKSGYKHFMLKEIFEQPRVINDTLKGRLTENEIVIDELNLTDKDFREINKIMITACGTAYHAGLVGKYQLESLARVPVEIDVASEFRYRTPVLDKNTLVIAITQSGETTDTIVSFREAISKGVKSLAVSNMVGSSITRETDNVFYTRAGLEIGVAATKTFTAQLVAMALLSIKIGTARKVIGQEDFTRFRTALVKLPSQVEKLLKSYEKIRDIARKYYKCNDFLFLGRNISYPVALEGALKLKEISYIHAEGYAAGEMKHGPIALVDSMVPVVSILPTGPVFEKILSNVKEVKARQAVTIGITNEGEENLEEYFDDIIFVPTTEFFLSPILTTIPLQLLAYFIAEKKERDVDQPRNLAKSVTVE